jgi:hypothetical protein
MLEMLLDNQAQGKTEQRLRRERVGFEQERMPAEKVHRAAKYAECTERGNVGPRQNM